MVDVIIDFDDLGWVLRRSNRDKEDSSRFLNDNGQGFIWALKCAKKIVRHSGYRQIVITKTAAEKITAEKPIV